MKPPTFAPAYVALFPTLSEIAQKHGYALTIHGSVSRDFDLVAIPWTDEAVHARALVLAMAQHCHLVYGVFGTGLDGPEVKPHGRLAWSLIMGSGSVIDLSVMPLLTTGITDAALQPNEAV